MTPDDEAGLVETHSAVVVFFGERAFKVKKPVDLGFLDFRTRKAREAICRREVELNQRLAPDVYLGVADILGPDGAPCDHMVVMRRLPADRRLSTLVSNGAHVDSHLRDVAHQLAALHGRSARSPAADVAAGLAATRQRWTQNTDALRRASPDLFDASVVEAVDGLASRYLDGRDDLFHSRVQDGRAVDGHGDLLADDIFCLDDGPRILDCIEFDDDLRFGDGLADAAFLAMDLERLGRADLSRSFLRHYAEMSGDVFPTSLAHHHIAYRAQVRAKVSAVRVAQGDAASGDAARRLLEQAQAHLLEGRVRLVLVGGLPGTGKSTLAAGLERELGVTVMRSDQLRRAVGAAGPEGHQDAFGSGLYAPRMTAATYQHLLHDAESALSLGDTVVLDASWMDPSRRAHARALAQRTSADLVELRCDLPRGVADERIRIRQATGHDPSAATPEIAARMAESAAAWPEAITVDTTDSSIALAEVMRVVAGPLTAGSAPR